jgi:hypothetical protein
MATQAREDNGLGLVPLQSAMLEGESAMGIGWELAMRI